MVQYNVVSAAGSAPVLPPYHAFKGLTFACSACSMRYMHEVHPHEFTATGFTTSSSPVHNGKAICICGCLDTDAVHGQTSYTTKYPTLGRGMTGKWVTALQGVIQQATGANWGFGSLTKFDSTMTHHLTLFQKSVGLTPDGIVGPRTWESLLDVAAANRASAAQRAAQEENVNKSAVFGGKGIPDWWKDRYPPGTAYAAMERDYTQYLTENAEPRFRGIRNGQSRFDVLIMVEKPGESWELVPVASMAAMWGTDDPAVRSTARSMIFLAWREKEAAKAEDMSYTWYDVFAERIVANLPLQGWEMTFDTVQQVIMSYEEALQSGRAIEPRNNTGSGAGARAGQH